MALLRLFSAALVLGATLGAAASISVRTSFGEVRYPFPDPKLPPNECTAFSGLQLASGVAQFLGIPFASSKRWGPPEDWNRTYAEHTGEAMGPSCPQPEDAGLVWNESYTSEDCLNVNLWCPTANTTTRAPVMVFLFGGGFTGGGNNPFNGSHLAASQAICVAVPNYRFGPLGFLAIPGRKSSGMHGIMDQQSALRWVKTQIVHFNGDSERVLLSGQSAGAGSVIFHLVSPFSKGLFSAAMIESGGFFSEGPADGRAYFEALKRQLGCDSLECMESKDAKQIIHGASYVTDAQPMPIVDGYILPDHPVQLLRVGRINPVLSVSAGCNSNESTIVTANDPSMRHINRTRLIGLIKELIPPDAPNGTIARVIQAYMPYMSNDNGPLYDEIMTDMYCTAKMRFVLSQVSKRSSSTRCYNYRSESLF